MRVVIPVISLERGGGTRFLQEVGNGLCDRGHDIQYVIVAGKRVEFSLRGKVTFVPRLVPEYMPVGDLVLPNFYATVYASLSGRAMPARICLSYEPLFVEDKAGAAETYRIPMPIATISGWLQGILAERAGRRSIVINPGIDHRTFYPIARERLKATVLCIGRPVEQGYGFKGYPHFAQAMSLVRARRPDVHVIVASPELRHHGLPFPATLVASPADSGLAELFRQVTVFVFPSIFEGFGLPPLEAMACGAPVVTTACGGVSDFARHEENCLMTVPGDIGQLAEAVLRLLGDPPLCRRLSAAAVECARPWTWARTVEQTERFLASILRGECII